MSSAFQTIEKKNSSFKINFFKVKYSSNQTLPSQYNLCVQFDQEKIETEKINQKEQIFDSMSYTFSFNPKKFPYPPIIISAHTSSWLVLSTKIASITIPLSPNKMNSQRQWYYLKNENEENILSILISFSSEIINEKMLHNKTEISINEQNHSSIINSLLNRTTMFQTNISNKHTSYDSGMIKQKNNISVSMGNVENSFNGENRNFTLNSIFEILNEKSKKLNDVEEKLKMQNLNNNLTFEKIKDREGILKKERNKLEEKVKKYKEKQREYETKSLNFAQNNIKLEKEVQKFKIEQEIYDYDKEYYSNLNFIYLLSGDLNNFLQPKTKFNKNSIFSSIDDYKNPINIGNKNIPTNTHNIIIENPNNNINLKEKNYKRIDNPSKKSNSTNLTSTNASEISLNDYNLIKTPPITQIYLNTKENEPTNRNFTNKFIETLDSDPNNMTKRRTITNYSYLKNRNVNNSLQRNSLRKNSITAIKKRQNKCGGGSNNISIGNNNKSKLKKQFLVN